MAPPLTFTLPGSRLSSLMQCEACEAKASLISKRSMSFVVTWAMRRASGMANCGPMPITAGSTPTTAKLRSTPKTRSPRRFASARRMSTHAAAPSVTWEELPAVVVPPGWKAGASFPNFSTVTPGRMPSSWSSVTAFSSPDFLSTSLVVMGTISALKRPLERAAAARACDLAAIWSWTSLETLNLAATFSLVMPIGMRHAAADSFSSMLGLAPPSHVMGFTDMDSTPPAIPMS
mmetsp:Transcript_5485/g.15482  ORF Transcript_5485/g.15482 Transcript_5485/m.15482 type:complete len:233 (+) Transcript_5485:1115-1813(+)